jgi:replication factor A1
MQSNERQAPAPMDENYGNIQAIEGINPYGHSWTIRARVSKKTPLREWHNQKGEGKLFSVTFMDESGEIRATIFNSVGDNFDRWNELLQEGSVYFISSPCEVKFANKKFNNTSNDYELFLSRDTTIEKAQDQTNVPAIRYNFIPIGDLEKISNGAIIDCIGILKEISDVVEVPSKNTGKVYPKRDLTIVDDTLHQVRLTIWGDTANKFETPLESVIAFQSARVSDFNGRSLSLLASGGLSADPDIEQAHRLKGWYDAQGRAENYESHQNAKGAGAGARNDQWKTIAQFTDEGLGRNPEKPDFFTVKATIEYLRQQEPKQMYYEACRSENCNKKVIEHDEGVWNCAACNKDWDSPQRRYVLSISVTDHTGSFYLSVFDDAGRILLGKSADELHELRDTDPEAFKEVTENAMCRQYIFRCRAKVETYQDQEKVRTSVSSLTPVNYATEAKRLQALITAYEDSNDGMFMS